MSLKDVLRSKRQRCKMRTSFGHQVCSQFCHDMLCDPPAYPAPLWASCLLEGVWGQMIPVGSSTSDSLQFSTYYVKRHGEPESTKKTGTYNTGGQL